MTEEYTRETMPTVPDGMVRITAAGYSPPPSLCASYTHIAGAVGALHGFPTVSLFHTTRGYVIAGSAMRWAEAEWHVNWHAHDGGIHGRRFVEANEVKARAYFAELTDGQAVSRLRQQLAQREDEARDETAACAAVADTVTIEAAKTYPNHWQWKADFTGMRQWMGYEPTKKRALQAGRAAIMHRVYCQRAEQGERKSA